MSKWKFHRKSGGLFQKPPCHSGPVEVIENLFCGSGEESLNMVSAPVKVDTLIPLHDLGAEIWHLGFRGEILYCPIRDYGTLPDDVLEALTSKILDRLSRGKKVGLFCVGGHGRTGYVASVVLGKLGHEDPIQFLRSKYCRNAVESDSQILHIAEILEKPELVEKYAGMNAFDGIGGLWPDYFMSRYDFGVGYLPESKISVCGDCARFIAGKCQKFNTFVDEYDPVCDDFAER